MSWLGFWKGFGREGREARRSGGSKKNREGRSDHDRVGQANRPGPLGPEIDLSVPLEIRFGGRDRTGPPAAEASVVSVVGAGVAGVAGSHGMGPASPGVWKYVTAAAAAAAVSARNGPVGTRDEAFSEEFGHLGVDGEKLDRKNSLWREVLVTPLPSGSGWRSIEGLYVGEGNDTSSIESGWSRENDSDNNSVSSRTAGRLSWSISSVTDSSTGGSSLVQRQQVTGTEVPAPNADDDEGEKKSTKLSGRLASLLFRRGSGRLGEDGEEEESSSSSPPSGSPEPAPPRTIRTSFKRLTDAMPKRK